jgi:hypothetical protein
MNNDYTRAQIRAWIENAIEKAKHPDQREVIKKERMKRSQKVQQKFGL